MRRPPRVEAVAVVLEALARVVREPCTAEPAFAARDIRARHDPVAWAQRRAVAREHLAAGLGDDADVLVAADQRVLQPPFVRRPRVLDRLAAKRVLVGAADAGIEHLHQDSARLDLRTRELLDADDTRRRHYRSADAAHERGR